MSEQEYKIDGRPATIFRVAKTKENPYVMIDKRIIDNKDLSFKAKGILTYLLSRPDGWEVNLEDLSNRGTDGLAAVKSGVKELKDAGYLKHAGIRKASGQFETVIWKVYEVPQVGNQLTDTPTGGVSPQVDFQSPQVDYPQVENPQVDNRIQVLKELSNNELNNKSTLQNFSKIDSVEWLVVAGVSSEEIEKTLAKERLSKEITDCWEKSMGYNPLSWSKLERLKRFLITKTPEEIKAFAKWSRREYSTFTPASACRFPDKVIELWPQAFLETPNKVDTRLERLKNA
jgi:hypothetical protein